MDIGYPTKIIEVPLPQVTPLETEEEEAPVYEPQEEPIEVPVGR